MTLGRWLPLDAEVCTKHPSAAAKTCTSPDTVLSPLPAAASSSPSSSSLFARWNKILNQPQPAHVRARKFLTFVIAGGRNRKGFLTYANCAARAARHSTVQCSACTHTLARVSFRAVRLCVRGLRGEGGKQSTNKLRAHHISPHNSAYTPPPHLSPTPRRQFEQIFNKNLQGP